MASAILSSESFNDAVEKALEALKDSSIESLTKYQSKALFHVLNGEDTFVSLPTGTLLAEAFPLCFSALYCYSLRGFGCSRFVLFVSGPRKRPLQTAVWDSR